MDQSASGNSMAKGRRFFLAVVTTHFHFIRRGKYIRVWGKKTGCPAHKECRPSLFPLRTIFLLLSENLATFRGFEKTLTHDTSILPQGQFTASWLI